MQCHQSTYRGYIIGVERKTSIWLITVSPKTPDLPILHRYSTETRAQSKQMQSPRRRVELIGYSLPRACTHKFSRPPRSLRCPLWGTKRS